MSDKLEIVVDRRVLQGFVRRALRRFPREYAEALWGSVKGSVINIQACLGIKHQGTRNSVDYESEELQEQEQEAREQGLLLLGTIHTHPNLKDCSPSESDWFSAREDGELIAGICAIWLVKQRRRTRTVFWPRLADYEVQVNIVQGPKRLPAGRRE